MGSSGNWGSWVWVKWKAGAPSTAWEAWTSNPSIKGVWSTQGDWDCAMWVNMDSPDQTEDFVWKTVRENKWGRDRKYVVAFLSSGSPQQPLAEFVAADDYEETRELVAVIRGSDGGRRMYGAGDALPSVYKERFRTQMYSDRVVYPGVWNKVVVVAREDDDATVLDHALIQGRRRYPT